MNGTIALSPDGSVLVYEGWEDEQSPLLWVRRWDQLDARALPVSTFGTTPAVSPDGREVAFVRLQPGPRPIQVVAVETGGTRTLTDSAFCCLQWAPDGYVYFADLDRGISRVAESGGPREVLTRSGPSRCTWRRDSARTAPACSRARHMRSR